MEVSSSLCIHWVGVDVFRPDTKELFKRQWKDVSTNARFSLFRAKKKLERKV